MGSSMAKSDAVQHAPAFTLRLLERLGIATQKITNHREPNAAQRVRTVLLEDQHGLLLVLLGGDLLLDLRNLHRLTGRALQALRPERLQRMLDKQQLDCLPGLPALTSAVCLYDRRLLQQTSLLIESGQSGVLLELGREAFTRLLGQAQAADLGVSLANIPLNLKHPDLDLGQISQAVQKSTRHNAQQPLAATLAIPPLSKVAQRLLILRVDPDSTVDDITRVVESDPQLTTLLLQWAATPGFAVPGKVRSVEDALVRVLGFDLGSHMALGLAVGRILPTAHTLSPSVASRSAASVTAAIAALIAVIPRAQRPESRLGCLCGLLHNIGFAALAHAFAQRFPLLHKQIAVNPQLHHAYIEQQLFGITRAQLGSWLLRNWDMPEEVSIAVRFQNDPDYAGPHALYANLLCLALHLLAAQGIGAGPLDRVTPALFERLGLERQTAEAALAATFQAVAASGQTTRQLPSSMLTV